MMPLRGLLALPFLLTESAAVPNIAQEKFVAPTSFKQGCSGLRPQAAAVGETLYFLPTPGSAPLAFQTFNTKSKKWDSLPITETRVGSMLDGASFTAAGDFLVVSGGKSKHVLALNTKTGKWTAAKDMANSQENACAIGCRGYFYSMTGDMVKADDEEGRRLKPANRQVYRYNFTSGEVLENNGKKSRGGAGCGCDPVVDRLFWAGGFSNSGVTADVEMWSADPFKRRGEPTFSTSQKRRDVGAAVCNGKFIVAGGTDGKAASNTVDIFQTNSSTGGSRVTVKLGAALKLPRVACLGGRVALISGGDAGKGGCNTKVFLLDTATELTEGASLPVFDGALNAAGQVSVATDEAAGSVMFFDGHTGDLFTLSSEETLLV
eukprot:gb/GFBE01070470.1/.p1 GENE.gb/GFBE01070470.1/~~gb/GFBE01070470.1/.p1  ORF type:complete len:377 (+),score=95.39 gb/GFBE01070470.1/:1-1131(+)